jgi:hypothetical protein
MINIKDKKCICGKRPSFGFENDEKATCCKDCKKEGMINIKDKKCICGKRPSFGFENDKKTTCCKDCKKEDMINIVSKKCICGKKQPNFGFENDKKATCCKDCKKEGMINIKNKKCKTELCNTQANFKYKGYCAYCYGNKYPNDSKVINYKTKERLVVDYIKIIYPNLSWKFDKIIEDACSKRRPDIFLDLGIQIIIIEVDENQHQGYEDICENKRMMEISQDVHHRSIVFIRFNPDKYIDKNNKSISSCFSITKTTGKLKVNSDKKWNERLLTLKNIIDLWIEKKTNKTLEVIQLYYDEI